MNNYVISIIGPTAIGKTALSIKIAQHFNAEIISCDSRQFFKEMNIGTAVPSQGELKAANHHFIQHKSIVEDYNVGKFEEEALKKLDKLFLKNNIAVLVGGSGLYMNAVLEGFDDFPTVDPSIRAQLNQEIEKGNLESLQEKLKELDINSYHSIKIENPRRLIRALEICIGTGKPYSSFKNKSLAKRNFIPIKIGLMADREVLYQRINKRVDVMMEAGLLKEAKKLFEHRELNALQTVGYKELFNYFDGKYSLEFAVEEIKKNTRRFAKRQITWNKKDKSICWFDFQTESADIIKYIERKINNA